MRSYKDVPACWFWAIMFVSTVAAMVIVQTWKHIFQLPWWGVLVCMFLNLFFTLPIGVIAATTNRVCTQQPPKLTSHYSFITQVISQSLQVIPVWGSFQMAIFTLTYFQLFAICIARSDALFNSFDYVYAQCSSSSRFRTTCQNSHDFFRMGNTQTYLQLFAIFVTISVAPF